MYFHFLYLHSMNIERWSHETWRYHTANKINNSPEIAELEKRAAALALRLHERRRRHLGVAPRREVLAEGARHGGAGPQDLRRVLTADHYMPVKTCYITC